MKKAFCQTLRAIFLLVATGCATTNTSPSTTVPSSSSRADQTTLPDKTSELHEILDDAAKYGPDEAKGLIAIRAARKLFEDLSQARVHGWKGARAIFLTVLANKEVLTEELANQCNMWSQVNNANKAQVETHLYHALCQGLMAQAFPTKGLGLIKEMLKGAQQVEVLDKDFDHSAGARLLGGIYLKAPAWPTSVGDSELAVEHLERAVEASSKWPENKLLLAEAYYEEDQTDEAKNLLEDVRRQLAHYPDNGWRRYFTRTLEEVTSELADD